MVHITILGMNNSPVEAAILRRESHPTITNLPRLAWLMLEPEEDKSYKPIEKWKEGMG
jgi:hypothetical protein